MLYPTKDLKSKPNEKPVHVERVADYAVYDCVKKLYCIVGEIKSSDSNSGEAQNIDESTKVQTLGASQ